MEKITYGVPRLVDWVAQIKAGAATVKVHFAGGALTSYGVTPAEYTTANPFIQRVIEQSSYFKEGRITVLRRATLPDPAMPAKATKPKPQPPAAAPETQVAPQSVEDAASEMEVSEEAVTEEAADNAGEADSGLTQVEVSCLQDAQAYLQEHFQISSYKVRSCEAAQKAAAEYGIQFVGGKFYPAYADCDTTGEEE